MASASRGSMMWCGCEWNSSCSSGMSASARSSVGALARPSLRSLLISLVTARASGSRSHLRTSRKIKTSTRMKNPISKENP